MVVEAANPPPAPSAPRPAAAADDPRVVRAWALYDFGNSAFATTVLAGFFPLFFGAYYSAGASEATVTSRLGLANAAASAVVLLSAPLLGALADGTGRRKAWLALCMTLGAGATFGLAFVGRGDWGTAAALFALGAIGFQSANVFYDGLLVNVASPAQRDRVSALGYGYGYVGGGVLFALNVAMFLAPGAFGITWLAGDPAAAKSLAIRLSFVSVALWWALFTVPLLRRVPERAGPRAADVPAPAGVASVFGEVGRTAGELARHPTLRWFLVAYWLYIDGVHTIIVMAVNFGRALGLPQGALIGALLLVQFIGVPGAALFVRASRVIGARRAVVIGVAAYATMTVTAVAAPSVPAFFALAVGIGLVQGGVQALSRSLYSQLVPPARAAEYFGFFNMVGKFAAVVGPLLVALAATLFGTRLSMLALLALFVPGALLLARLPLPGRAEAPAEAP